jgi:hypothetical protein
MPSNSIKCEGNLGKIILVALKYLIYAMQNSPCGTPQAHRSDLAPGKYPTGVTDSSRISISPDMHCKTKSGESYSVLFSDTNSHRRRRRSPLNSLLVIWNITVYIIKRLNRSTSGHNCQSSPQKMSLISYRWRHQFVYYENAG